MKAIIEHLEPEMYEWCILEYTHMSLRLGKENLLFTNVPDKDREKIIELGTVYKESILELQETEAFKSLALLDPKGKEECTPEHANQFNYFVFGGILGDHPMKGRTEKHFTKLKALRLRLGAKQMSTDTAVITTHKILDEKIPFEQLEFQDGIEINFEQGYSQVFPFRYLLEEGKLVFTPGLIDLLKKEDDFAEQK